MKMGFVVAGALCAFAAFGDAAYVRAGGPWEMTQGTAPEK